MRGVGEADFRIAVTVEETAGVARRASPIRFGIPLPRGLLLDAAQIELVAGDQRGMPLQVRTLAKWPDGSIKWALIDTLLALPAYGTSVLTVTRASAAATEPAPKEGGPRLVVAEEDRTIIIDTGPASFTVDRRDCCPVRGVQVSGAQLLTADGCRVRLLDVHGNQQEAVVSHVGVEEAGPVRVAVVCEGYFRAGARRMAHFRWRAAFHAGSTCLELDFEIGNPHAARHIGGLWDLGDRGSYRFEDLSLCLTPAGPLRDLGWSASGLGEPLQEMAGELTLYQDSSGGRHWNSLNHLDADGKLSVTFPGYRVLRGTGEDAQIIAEGARATPYLIAEGETGWLAATVRDFWQNFPKALRLERGSVTVGLFPRECRSPFELQGGERKRHTVFLDFGTPSRRTTIAERQYPLTVRIDPAWVEASRAVPYLLAAAHDDNESCKRYVQTIVEGPASFVERREQIDEYGWRNFGDLYADHEAVGHPGPEPLVSHYNNQYDFVYGAAVQYLRTGDVRWRPLLEDAARHTIDIDIYHTCDDRAAFNGGMFWHTDHYKPARTCSHRTYSRRNAAGPGYGGGPSNEHNYTSGLLLYFYLSGAPEARESVLGLADWVIAMDDGARTLFGLLDERPTGLASKTLRPDYHKPGRGAGNSINALLDAHALCGERRYMRKAEELIERCIHPDDDVDALGLSDPEYRWSYLVFLQALGKYLDSKLELAELDYPFYYARGSLLRYADWMCRNEVPYKDVLHKVEMPTETWPAQDIRKCHVLHLAASYAASDDSHRLFSERAAFFFDRCLADLLSFKTAYLTRPLVILCVHGHVHAFFQRYGARAAGLETRHYAFGSPGRFAPQRAALGAVVRRKLHVAVSELKWMARSGLHSLAARLRLAR